MSSIFRASIFHRHIFAPRSSYY